MRCKYCGAEMRLDDKDVTYGRGGVCVVDKYWCCDNCGASAYELWAGDKSDKLEFYPPEG